MNALVTFALRQRVLVVILLVLALAGGVAAFLSLNIEAYPDPVPPLVDCLLYTSSTHSTLSIPVDSAPATGPDRVADAPKPDTRAAVQPVRSLPSHSIRARLYAVFAILLLLVLGLGVFGVARLADVNRVSEVIRNHWLQATRILGDVSNYMSDYRTAEGSHLLSTTPLELAASDKEILALGETVERSQRAYEAVPHGPAESVLYAQFAEQWRDYQSIAAQVLALARAGRTREGVVLYMSTSRRAFDRCV